MRAVGTIIGIVRPSRRSIRESVRYYRRGKTSVDRWLQELGRGEGQLRTRASRSCNINRVKTGNIGVNRDLRISDGNQHRGYKEINARNLHRYIMTIKVDIFKAELTWVNRLFAIVNLYFDVSFFHILDWLDLKRSITMGVKT